ncbi:MAG: LysM peptidoglycan-binding domain-containing protein [Rickettsiales bacterium]|nr:LysM peptidoglycan-binding domain-containing protein [Rickettsiales bacterium]
MSNQSQTTSQNIANNLKDAYNIANSLVYKVPGIGPAAQAIGFSNALIVNTTVDVVVNNDPAVRSILSLSASTIAFTGCSLGTSGNVIIGFGCGFLASKAAEEIYDAYFGSDFGSDGGRLELENSLQIGQSGMYRDSNGNIKVCYYGDDEVFEERSLQEIVSNVTTDLQVKSVDVTDTDTGTNVQIDDDNNLKLQTTAPITEPEQQSILQNIAPLARPTTATSYSIESGDTLSNIASANGTTVEALMELNPNITDPNIINVGDSLVLTQNQDAQVKNININGDEYNAYQSDVSEVNDSGILGEGEQVNITKIENEDGSIISFVEEQEVILSDGTQISSRELIHTGEEAKGALQNFMDSHIMQSVKQSFTDPETLSGWALDSVRMLANGEEIDDIATYIFLKSAIEGTIEGLVFDQALQTLELNNSQIDLIKNSVVEGSTQNLPPELQDMLQGLLESAKFQFISGSIVTFVTSILMQADDGLNSEEYAESAFQAIGTEAVSLGLEKAFPGLGGSVGHGAAMAITYAITRSISDIFEDDHMNSHQWNSMVNTSSAMFVSGMAGHAAGTAIATALASSTASAATLGMLLGPLGSMVAVMVVMSLIGGKEYGEGEYPNPYSFLKFTDKDDGTGQTIYGLEADGVVARARDGFDDDIVGTDGADNLIGGSGTNRIYGQEGNDHIEGRDSDDVLVGGTGNDLVEAGAGDDYIFGDEGSDIIYGGSGADQIDSGDGNDIVYGDSGDDVIVAGIVMILFMVALEMIRSRLELVMM